MKDEFKNLVKYRLTRAQETLEDAKISLIAAAVFELDAGSVPAGDAEFKFSPRPLF